ncbi:MAG: rRNA pseudouridine synthase [bacterium]|nr:rRNA pseudouridine synthase [bacterium]
MTSTGSGDQARNGERGPRLDGFLSRAGLASRKQARALIKQGRVTVDGEVCRDASRRIGDEVVALDEAPVESPVSRADFLMHKPVGVACSHDEREAPLVFDLLDARLRARSLKIAGRLDRETSGLLVLTTDGDFIHRMTHPTRKVAKRYRVEYRGALPEDAAARCREGILLNGEDKPTRPAELVVEDDGRATLVLREGRTHQVRRMFRALGATVTTLHRDRVAALDLPPDLAPGDLRPLAPEERALLLSESSL